MGEVSLLINGLYVKVPVGKTLLDAARQLDIDIPTLCYHPDLKPEGQCRLCLVEIGEWPRTRLVNSCTYPAEKGLTVQTHSEKVLEARRMVLELLLARTPKAELIQKMAAEHGVTESRFKSDRPRGTLYPLWSVRPHLPRHRRRQRHQHDLSHPGQTGGHTL